MNKNEVKTNKVGKIEEMINNCYKYYDEFEGRTSAAKLTDYLG